MDQMSGAECPLHTLDRTGQPQPTPLEPMTFPLHGARLIEASAGTGKTFTIAGLYLRLCLVMAARKLDIAYRLRSTKFWL